MNDLDSGWGLPKHLQLASSFTWASLNIKTVLERSLQRVFSSLTMGVGRGGGDESSEGGGRKEEEHRFILPQEEKEEEEEEGEWRSYRDKTTR